MKKWIMSLILRLVMSLALAMTFYGTAHAATAPMSISQLLADTNVQRTHYGETSLRLNTRLDAAAQAKANDMVAKNYWSHVSPSGVTPWVFIANSGYVYSMAGENLAYGFATPADVVTAWMNSPEHRANVLKAGYVDVGFGFANSTNFVGSGPETIVVAEYGTPTYVPPAAKVATAQPIVQTKQPTPAKQSPAKTLAAHTQPPKPKPTEPKVIATSNDTAKAKISFSWARLAPELLGAGVLGIFIRPRFH